MGALDRLPFLKMNGLGNEIVVVDLRASSHVITPEEAQAIAAQPRAHFEQLMVLHAPRSAGTSAFMRIYNTDGSLASACGNGTRCVAWALGRDGGPDRLLLETDAGLLDCSRLAPERFTVDMGAPRLGWREIPLSREVADTSNFVLAVAGSPHLGAAAAVNMGNPHVVFFVADQSAYDFEAAGPLLERDPLFPERANVSFAQVLTRDHILLRVWERGAGPTQACGSAACATAVAAVRRGLAERDVTISLPGGDLAISWRASDSHVLMTGPVELEWEDRLPVGIGAALPMQAMAAP